MTAVAERPVSKPGKQGAPAAPVGPPTPTRRALDVVSTTATMLALVATSGGGADALPRWLVPAA
ncbi:hypothetical protein [Nocardioides sp. B-3]|uniref:hypothetical protein n=1 Tax=Nocardioides sp. B-3 TaxID=2895565 RepID=UPI0021521101|nr:hypothetical protein [Nocardioides sp. B-3]UUZ61563.1 hypothetical protein LP418_14030 [Nocardioides sp. B-3]